MEQLLTTGGGWQDQVGGLCRGVKLGHSRSNLPLEIEVDHVTTNKEVLQLFNDHLVLIYTGQTRLAKNLLQVFVIESLPAITHGQVQINTFKQYSRCKIILSSSLCVIILLLRM